jgi:hypothetical protein
VDAGGSQVPSVGYIWGLEKPTSRVRKSKGKMCRKGFRMTGFVVVFSPFVVVGGGEQEGGAAACPTPPKKDMRKL